jgi:hypothetical protein
MRVATGRGVHIGQVTAIGRSVCTWPRWRPMALCAPVPRRMSSVTTTRRLMPYAYVTNVYVPDLAVAYLRAPGAGCQLATTFSTLATVTPIPCEK